MPADTKPVCTCTGPARDAHDVGCPVRQAHPRADLGDLGPVREPLRWRPLAAWQSGGLKRDCWELRLRDVPIGRVYEDYPGAWCANGFHLGEHLWRATDPSPHRLGPLLLGWVLGEVLAGRFR